jgi:hypothetical protein
MNLDEYNISGVDKNDVIKELDHSPYRILLFGRVKQSEIPHIGLANLLAVDGANNIFWIAELPKGQSYPVYDNMRLKDEHLEAWCGSQYCLINPITGKIIKEEFIW